VSAERSRHETVRLDDAISVRPVGFVRATADERVKLIEVPPKLAAGLEGIESQNHLWILYWMHALPAEKRKRLRVHPRGDRTQPKRGVFALHSPCRPNPIGMTRVRLIRREENRLLVEGLDAVDGSPVLDIKSG